MKGRLLVLLLVQASVTLQNENGSLTGRVTRQDGQPASGVRVAVLPVPDAASPDSSSALISLGETGIDGRYRLENIPPGRYYIMAGLVDFPTYYPGVTDLRVLPGTYMG